MGVITTTADTVYRDYETDGVPASGPHDPVLSDIRSLFGVVDDQVASIQAGQASGTIGYTLKATMDADLAHPAGTIAKVGGDPTPSNNGTYLKSGASGSGSWAAWTDPTVTAVAAYAADAATDRTGAETAETAAQTAQTAAETAATNAAASAASMTGVAANFNAAVSRNVYQTTMFTPNSSFNVSGSVGASTTFSRVMIPVTAGQQTWVSIETAPSNWIIYASWVQEYNSATPSSGALVNNATPGEDGLTYSNGNRRITITPAAGVTYLGVSFSWPGGGTPTSGDITNLQNAIMANYGASLADFDLPIVSGAKVYSSAALNDVKDVLLIKSGTDVYVRHPYQGSTTQDVVRQLSVGTTPTATVSGAVNFFGARLIPRDTPDAATLLVYNSSTLSTLLGSGGDESPPIQLRGVYLGGQHGVSGTFLLQKTAHGLTAANVGEVGSDGAAKSWVLTSIVDADHIWVTAANTGTSTDWTISGTITGSSITFPTAGVFSFTASSSVELGPILQSYTSEIRIDGVAITADGFYRGDLVIVREKYGIPNPASLLSALIAAVGTGSPPAFNSSTIQKQLEVDCSYRFDEFGACVRVYGLRYVQGYTRIGGSTHDYYGAMQWQTPNFTGDHVYVYVPDLTGPITVGAVNYDLTATADITTAPSGNIVIPKTLCVDPTNPASHFAALVKSSGGVPKRGHARGYSRRHGVGVPAVRAAKVTKVGTITNARKSYPVAVDDGAGVAVAGTYETTVTWDAYYDMSGDTRRTIDVFYRDIDGKAVRVLDISATVSAEWFNVPPTLVGKPVSVIDANSGFTLNSADTTHGDGMLVTTSGGYGRAVIAIG